MEYLSIRQTAEKWGISNRRIQVLCKQGRIPGSFIVGNSWAIPAEAVKPKDQRIKSGKYIKKMSQKNNGNRDKKQIGHKASYQTES